MANLTFPSNPTNGQKVTVNDKVFVYNSTTGRWTATRLQVLGNLTDDFTIDAPSLGVSLANVALDTTGANVYVTYTVDQDVKASITTSGIANSDLATISLSQSNNTITITAGTLAFSNGQINLVVTNGRTSNTAVIDVSAAYESAGWTFVRFSQSIDENNDPIDQTGTYSFTPVGNATTSDTQTKFASRSLYFPDNSSYYLMAAGLIPSEPMIAEAWIYPTSNENWTIISNRDTGSSGDSTYEISLYRESSGLIKRRFGGFTSENTTGVAPLNEWTHVAVGLVGSGGASNPNVVAHWVNGVRVSASSGQGFYYIAPQDPVHIGGGGTGYIENVQVVRTAKYGTTHVLPTAEQTISYQNPYDT